MTAVDATSDDPQPTRFDRVLIAAPFGRDSDLLRERLEKFGIASTACHDADDLVRELALDATALILSQEALTPRMLDALGSHLTSQPNWSELPLVLLLDGEHQNRAVLVELRERLPSSKLTVLQRPVRSLELVTAVQTALAARRRQLELRDHMVWQDELQRELNHRVKNILANVVAIYHMTMRQSTTLEAFATSFEGRLLALSRVHNTLTVSDAPRSLMEIATVVLQPYHSVSPKRVAIEGPLCTVTPQMAVTFALCLHELATNASKYGALSVSAGSVSLVWQIEPEAVLVRWSETGGPPVKPPSRRGYGTSFIESAANGGLQGKVDFLFHPGGLICEIVLPAHIFVRVNNEIEGVEAPDSIESGTVRAVTG